ncbi:Na(+)/H(+) antiporter subunit G [Rubrobacter xylanophilus DSM 9941]|uniref:monovalent cation/H(+) antiporter subunit G n=1 Tax=Rubrobacter xylanophilus TaxID=49319 RepID=UPI001C63C764|nr:monovalent cation/H(+) antiporter subunit G [Rubrobacter xylanophilus]QYJ16129.1 Na(+)/H(+) antiporter subunit G [Rubrobacter xylanophilus DSM 9941]
MGALLPWIADALVVLGVAVITVGVYGMIRMPDTYTRLHAASKAVFLGVISLLAASVVTGQPAIIFRVVLISLFLLLTSPVAAHVIGQAAYRRGERMLAPNSVDESGRDLDRMPREH